MPQTTSTNNNESLWLALWLGELSGPYHAQFRFRIHDYDNDYVAANFDYNDTAEPANGTNLTVQIRSTGTIVLENWSSVHNETLAVATGGYTGWATLDVSWDGANHVATFTPDGGSPVAFAILAPSSLGNLRLFGPSWQDPRVNMTACALFVYEGALTSGEATAQAGQPEPIDTSGGSGAELWAWLPMDAWETAHLDATANDHDASVGGDGITVEDVPYSADPEEIEGTLTEVGSVSGTDAIVAPFDVSGSLTESAGIAGTDAIVGADPDNVPDIGTPLTSVVWMVTGHSLSEGVSVHIGALAGDGGYSYDWQEQRVIGSPFRVRTSGMTTYPDSPENVWEGYSTGINRDGGNLDLITHFRNVTAVNGKTTANPYNAVLLCERHDLPTVVRWEYTVELIRHYYELIREGSPNCVGYVYGTWLGFENVTLTQWIQHMREQQSATAALASRINLSLANESRSDRLMAVPTASALGNLLEAATTGEGLPGVTVFDGGDIDEEETVAFLFSDEVHPTEVGRYFLGCVCYSTLYRRDCRGLARPSGMDETTADSLQQVAWDSVVEKFSGAPLGEQYDQTGLKAAFVANLELSLTIAGNEDGLSEATSYYSGTGSSLHFNAGTDSGVWFDAPEGGETDVEGELSETGALAGTDSLGATLSLFGSLSETAGVAGTDAAAGTVSVHGSLSESGALAGSDDVSGAIVVEVVTGTLSESGSIQGTDAASGVVAVHGSVAATGSVAGTDAASGVVSVRGSAAETGAVSGSDAASGLIAIHGAVEDAGSLAGQDAISVTLDAPVVTGVLAELAGIRGLDSASARVGIHGSLTELGGVAGADVVSGRVGVNGSLSESGGLSGADTIAASVPLIFGALAEVGAIRGIDVITGPSGAFVLPPSIRTLGVNREIRTIRVR